MVFQIIFSLLISFKSEACTNEEFAKKISKKLPSGTEELVIRITSCNHFAGEDPSYDKERADFIESSVKRLKCDQIDKDKESLLKKNPKKQTELKKAFDSAEQWDEGSCR